MLPTASFTVLHTARVPIVGTFHMLNVSDRWYRLFSPVVRRAARRLSARIAVSEPARRFAARWVPGHYHVIPNALDVTAYRGGEDGRGAGRVLFVGRPDRRKGLPILLRAFARLPNGFQLELAGVGENEVGALANGVPRAVMKRVRAHGRVSDDGRRRLLASADVLCAPSLGGESFGLVVVEGMAAGLPVVASDIDGYRDVLPGDCGRLVPPGDDRALAAALGDLLADPALRRQLGEKARESAQRFDWTVVAQQVLEVYREALAI
jgi:phosphatidylinositol alpha-mannosyltransferase